MVRGRPSGRKAACGTATRRPAAGLAPGASAAPERQEPKGQAHGLPLAAHATLARLNRAYG
jgi:hypothetical protein